jgi:hypothetical protein
MNLSTVAFVILIVCIFLAGGVSGWYTYHGLHPVSPPETTFVSRIVYKPSISDSGNVAVANNLRPLPRPVSGVKPPQISPNPNTQLPVVAETTMTRCVQIRPDSIVCVEDTLHLRYYAPPVDRFFADLHYGPTPVLHDSVLVQTTITDKVPPVEAKLFTGGKWFFYGLGTGIVASALVVILGHK